MLQIQKFTPSIDLSVLYDIIYGVCPLRPAHRFRRDGGRKVKMMAFRKYIDIPAENREDKRSLAYFPPKLRARDAFNDYYGCVSDLISSSTVRRMDDFVQHGGVSTLEHCISVSYDSYILCRKTGMDYRSAARGGLLHDLYLYDWHESDSHHGMHAFTHPYAALDNAMTVSDLNARERDIIKKHMWPLTVIVPRFPETMVVSCVDKYCALVEFFKMKLSLSHSMA
jgi:uncharacterized protein